MARTSLLSLRMVRGGGDTSSDTFPRFAPPPTPFYNRDGTIIYPSAITKLFPTRSPTPAPTRTLVPCTSNTECPSERCSRPITVVPGLNTPLCWAGIQRCADKLAKDGLCMNDNDCVSNLCEGGKGAIPDVPVGVLFVCGHENVGHGRCGASIRESE